MFDVRLIDISGLGSCKERLNIKNSLPNLETAVGDSKQGIYLKHEMSSQ